MASFQIEFKRSAEHDLRQINPDRIAAILKRIENLSENPVSRQSLKLEGSKRMYRLRVGRFRVVYEVDQKRETIFIYYIRHRREAYRRL